MNTHTRRFALGAAVVVAAAVGLAGPPAHADVTTGSLIEATVVDAETGQPVAGICVNAYQLTLAVAHAGCGWVSEADGRVTLSVSPGSYQLFAVPVSGPPNTYGAQWVGFGRGTGRQLHAKSFVVRAGERVQVPVIRLDRAGTITGQVSTADGSALSFGLVGLLAGNPISGSGGDVLIDAEGRYTIDFLGPYEWPLLFEGSNQARQWSGQLGNRYLAEHIKVTSAAVTTYDFVFKPAVTLVATIQGQAPTWLLVFNAITGDIVANGDIMVNGQMRMLIAGPQVVKFLGVSDAGGGWIGGSDFFHAQPFWIPASGTKTVTLAF